MLNPKLARQRSWLLPTKKISPKRKAVAFAIAAAADVLQLAVFPAFAEGAASPFEDALDVGVAVILILVLGFHYRLALSFLLELVPGADLFPTWMATVASLPSAAPDTEPNAIASSAAAARAPATSG